MNENVKELLKKVSGDETLKAKFNNCKNEDEVVNFAKEQGFDIAKDDLKIDKEKLSEKELEMVSGGEYLNISCAYNGYSATYAGEDGRSRKFMGLA